MEKEKNLQDEIHTEKEIKAIEELRNNLKRQKDRIGVTAYSCYNCKRFESCRFINEHITKFNNRFFDMIGRNCKFQTREDDFCGTCKL